MSKIWQQLVNIWSRLEVAQKATIVLSFLGLMVLLTVIGWSSTRPDLKVLASGLTKAQTQEIAAYLDEARVTYSVADHGTTIMVQSKDVYKVGNELAQRDMLGDGSKGFELLGKQSSLWQSTFAEHKTYDRAVAGELERFFKEMPGVRSARVLIDRPQPSPFVADDEAKPKASVKLDMKPGARLSERQLQGVIHLCAGAVAGLVPQRVEIMDGTGLLTPKGADTGAGMAQTTLDAEAARETYLTRKAQDQLDVIFGPGRSQVKVGVKLDFARRQESSSDPTTKVLLKERTNTSDEKGEMSAAGGVAGTAPNVEGEGAARGPEPLKSSKTREETQNEYVVGTRKVTLEDEVGRIKGMTVSILLPLKKVLKPKLDDKGKPLASGEKEESFEEYGQADKDRFKELVLNAIGFNAAKDVAAKAEGVPNLDARFTASVQSVELFREPETTVAQAGLALPVTSVPLPDLVGYAVAGLVALIILWVARGQLARSHQAWKEADARARSVQEAEEKKNAPPPLEASEEEKEQAALKARRGELKDQIKKRITEDPAAASQVLRRWMYE
jgi:flagellar M-ring protein FliF